MAFLPIGPHGRFGHSSHLRSRSPRPARSLRGVPWRSRTDAVAVARAPPAALCSLLRPATASVLRHSRMDRGRSLFLRHHPVPGRLQVVGEVHTTRERLCAPASSARRLERGDLMAQQVQAQVSRVVGQLRGWGSAIRTTGGARCLSLASLAVLLAAC
jgi:hypothetical protein